MFRQRKARTELYHRYSRASDLPLLILAVLMIPVLLAPEILTLTSEETNFLGSIDWFIYGCFAFDFALKIYLAPSVMGHIKRNWLDLIVLLLPLLRPLRIISGARFIRIFRAARLLVFLAEGVRKLTNILAKRGLHIVLALTLTVVALCAGLVTLFERDTGGSIKSYGDAPWWAVTTITTVGYGDTFPLSVEGRGVAIFLMLTGIVFYSILTANMAAFFVESNEASDDKRVEEKLDLILKRLDAIEAALGRKASNEMEAVLFANRAPLWYSTYSQKLPPFKGDCGGMEACAKGVPLSGSTR